MATQKKRDLVIIETSWGRAVPSQASQRAHLAYHSNFCCRLRLVHSTLCFDKGQFKENSNEFGLSLRKLKPFPFHNIIPFVKKKKHAGA